MDSGFQEKRWNIALWNEDFSQGKISNGRKNRLGILG